MSAAAAQMCPVSETLQRKPGDKLHSNAILEFVSHPRELSRLASLQKSMLLRGLHYEDCREIVRAARLRVFSRREVLSREGDCATTVTLITSGRTKVMHSTDAGQEVILRFAGAGSITTGIAVDPDGVELYTVEAMEQSEALVWDIATFRALCTRFPRIQQNMVAATAAQLRSMEERYCELATAKVPTRVARTLRRLCDEIGTVEADGSILIRLSREEMAQIAGTTMFAVSRLLSLWEGNGILQSMREAVCIPDMGALVRLATES